MTSAIPAEVMAGGVSINMVTKDAGNKWRGDVRYNYTTGCLTPQRPEAGLPRERQLRAARRRSRSATRRSPATTSTSPAAARWCKDRLWVNGAVRRWIVNKLVNAKNADGTQAIDDNTLKNYSGKGVFSASSHQKLSFVLQLEQQDPRPSPRHAAEPRARHRLARPDQPGVVDAGEVHRHPQQDGVRVVVQHHERRDRLRLPAGYAVRPRFASSTRRRHGDQRRAARTSSSRTRAYQFDNILSYSQPARAGDHLFKGGVQFARLYYDDRFQVLNNYLPELLERRADQRAGVQHADRGR